MYPVTTPNEFRPSTVHLANAVRFEPLDCSVVGPGQHVVRHPVPNVAVEARRIAADGRNFEPNSVIRAPTILMAIPEIFW